MNTRSGVTDRRPDSPNNYSQSQTTSFVREEFLARVAPWVLRLALAAAIIPAVISAQSLLASVLIANAGPKTRRKFFEFFTVPIRNANTRAAYYRAIELSKGFGTKREKRNPSLSPT